MFALSPIILFYNSLNSSGLGAAVWVGDALSWQLSKVSCAHVQSVSASVLSQCKKYLSVCTYKKKSKLCDQGEISLTLDISDILDIAINHPGTTHQIHRFLPEFTHCVLKLLIGNNYAWPSKGEQEFHSELQTSLFSNSPSIFFWLFASLCTALSRICSLWCDINSSFALLDFHYIFFLFIILILLTSALSYFFLHLLLVAVLFICLLCLSSPWLSAAPLLVLLSLERVH